MNKSFVIALALIAALIKGSRGQYSNYKPNYKPRKNEAECSSRRCCSMRDELIPSDLPIGLNCNTLSDYECGQQDSYCEWDCDEKDPMKLNKNVKRRYRGISSRDGQYEEPLLPKHDGDEYDNKKLLQKCLSNGGIFISMDDCGVEYEEEIKDWDVICHQLYDEDHHNDQMYQTGNNDQHRRLQGGVLGPDGRTKVNNMDTAPYNSVLFMEATVGSMWSDCTATMISDNVAITAGHCVWGKGNWISQDFKFFWSVDNCNEKNGDITTGQYYHAISASVWNAYTQPGGNTAANDMALLTFDTNGRTHAYMGFGVNYQHKSGDSFTSIGYPGDKDDGCTPYQQTCQYQEIYADELVTSTCDHWHGQSGSAIWQWVNGGATVYGTISGGDATKNYDCRINGERYKWICTTTGRC